jgi:general secretion pathway protein D
MPVGPSQGGSPLNLFDLDQMRRQQMQPPQPRSSAPQPNAGTPYTVPAAPAVNGAVQSNPVPVAPSTASPGVQP